MSIWLKLIEGSITRWFARIAPIVAVPETWMLLTVSYAVQLTLPAPVAVKSIESLKAGFVLGD